MGVPTIQVKIPPPTLEMVMGCDAGLLQPAVNGSVVELTCMTGGCGGVVGETGGGVVGETGGGAVGTADEGTADGCPDD